MNGRCRWRTGKIWVAVSALLVASRGAGAQSLSYPAFRVGAFGDAIVSHSTVSGANDLDFGELDPYAAVQISESWSALGEALFQRVERGRDEDTVGGRRFDVDVERLFLAYSPADSLRVEAGEVSSGILAWNDREQRPRFLQTPIDMPAIARNQERGGAWPLHLLGAWVSGTLPGSAGFAYGAGIGRARGPARDDLPSFTGPGPLAGLFNVSFSPSAVPGLAVGGAAYFGRIPAPEGSYREIDETISSSYARGPLEVRAEWSRMNHQRAGRNHATEGWYGLVSVRLPDPLDRFRPYLLVDRLSVARDEPFLRDVRDQRAWASGVRFDAGRHLALKLEYRSQRARSADHERLVRAEIALAY
jgi:hypothetical protein